MKGLLQESAFSLLTQRKSADEKCGRASHGLRTKTPHPEMTLDMNLFSILSIVLTWLAVLVGGWLGWQLLRQNGRLLLRLEELEKRLDTLEFGEEDQLAGLSVGSDAPAFELPDLAGERKSLVQYRGQPLLLIFFNPACGYSRDVAQKLEENADNRKQKAEMENPVVLIISTGGVEANRALFKEHKLDYPVLLQKGLEVAEAYQAKGTPSGCLVSAQGKIASELAVGGEAVLELVEQKTENGKRNAEIDQSLITSAATPDGDARAFRFSNRSLARSKIKRDGLKAGAPAPDFTLPRLDGQGELSLQDFRGRRVLLVFSSPSCGPCLELAPQLEEYHREHPEPEVVMISKGEPKENRAKVKEYNLTFPIVLQPQWEVSRRYAIFATPVAYLIDEGAVIVRDVAVGTDAILGLAAAAQAVFSEPSVEAA